jgi:predicted Zn-dependent protease
VRTVLQCAAIAFGALWIASFLLGAGQGAGSEAKRRADDAAQLTDRADYPSRPVTAPGIYVVPLGTATAEADEAATIARRRFTTPVTVLPALPIDRTFYDEARGQLDATRMAATVARAHEVRARGAVVIAVTNVDIAPFDLEYVFSQRSPSGREAVISTSRLDIGPRGDDPTLHGPRLDVQVVRNVLIGAGGVESRAGFGPFLPIGSLMDLDALSGDVCPYRTQLPPAAQPMLRC